MSLYWPSSDGGTLRAASHCHRHPEWSPHPMFWPSPAPVGTHRCPKCLLCIMPRPRHLVYLWPGASPSQMVGGNPTGTLASAQYNVSSHPHTGTAPGDITILSKNTVIFFFFGRLIVLRIPAEWNHYGVVYLQVVPKKGWLAFKCSRGLQKCATDNSWMSFERFRNYVFLPKIAWNIRAQSWLPSP